MRIILALLFLSSQMSYSMHPFIISVNNCNDSGGASLRWAVAVFNQFRRGDYCCGIRFMIPDVKNPVITLESDIVIEEGAAKSYRIEVESSLKDQIITIQGKGRLIYNPAKITVSSNIVFAKQPQSLVNLAAGRVAILMKSDPRSIKRVKLLPPELRAHIMALYGPGILQNSSSKKGCAIS